MVLFNNKIRRSIMRILTKEDLDKENIIDRTAKEYITKSKHKNKLNIILYLSILLICFALIFNKKF